jgi:hypothetical protein
MQLNSLQIRIYVAGSYFAHTFEHNFFCYLFLGLRQHKILSRVFYPVSNTSNSFLQLRFLNQFLPTVPSETVETDGIVNSLKKLQKTGSNFKLAA